MKQIELAFCQRARNVLCGALTVAMLSGLVSCGRSNSVATSGNGASQRDATMSLVTLDEVRERVASQAGKVVIVNLWALW